ncbi:MAG: DNA methyltransferase [Ktedonobacteraceae bacterium]
MPTSLRLLARDLPPRLESTGLPSPVQVNRCTTKTSLDGTRRFVMRLHSTYATLTTAIEGIENLDERSHYASLLLHRLLFLYFLQQRGLLANDTQYLQHRLADNIDDYGFYRDVLYPLFTIREPLDDFPAPMSSLFIEPAHTHHASVISIPNTIFAHIFAFFDEYCWHLGDNADKQAGITIGPEVLDALFERGISQKEVGAYYTPVNVAGYITRNTLLPAIFTRTNARYRETGMCADEHWLVQQPECYLFAEMRKGYELPLPPTIAAGLHDVSQRQMWQEKGAEAYALPGETWREVIARRAHVHEISTRITQDENNKFHRIVTWNLDQQSLALDALRNCQQPAFLEAFYQSLCNLTVLDPTCGSGAFLLAALAQLEPLYLASLTRMENLLSTLPLNSPYSHQFHTHLENAGKPEQRPATIARWIVERNLYGVDLMAEAVELCRQRLFLHVLAAQPAQQNTRLATNVGSHIRVGNSLVGSLYAAETDKVSLNAQQLQAFHWSQEFPIVMRSGGFDAVIGNPPYVEYERVRQYYIVDGYATLGTGNLYALTMERSLHLLAPGGRFGMIVPTSATCTDGYRSLQQQLLAQQELHIASFSDQRGKLFDIPHPRLCIICYEKAVPTEVRPCRVFTTPYLKLERARGASLFERLHYTEVTQQVRPGAIPRYGTAIECAIQAKLSCQAHCLGAFLHPTGEHSLYFTRKLSWFVQVTPFIPLILDEQGQTRAPSELKILRFASSLHAHIAFVALNSNLFYWLITTGSDCRNLNAREVLGLPLDFASISPALCQRLCQLACTLAQDLQINSEMKPMVFQSKGRLTIQCMYPARSKHLIDEIDHLLAQHYGLSEHELDFLLHYDSKYRLTNKLMHDD